MAILDQIVVAFESKNSKELERALRKITQRMKDIIVSEEQLKKVSDKSSKEKLESLREEYSNLTKQSALARRRKAELDSIHRARVKQMREINREGDKAQKKREKAEKEEHKARMQRIKAEQREEQRRLDFRKKAILSIAGLGTIVVKSLSNTIAFSENHLTKAAQYNALYRRIGGMGANKAQGFDVALQTFGGSAGEGLNFLSNLTAQLGGIRYGESGLLEALGQFGVTGVGAFTKPQDVIRKLMRRAQGMDTFAQEAMFSKLNLPQSLRDVIRSGREDLIDLGTRRISDLSDEERKTLEDAGIRDVIINEEQRQIASSLSVISKWWSDFVKDNSEIAGWLKTLNEFLPDFKDALLGALAGKYLLGGGGAKGLPPATTAPSGGSSPSKTIKPTSRYFDEKTGRWRMPDGRFTTAPSVSSEPVAPPPLWSRMAMRFGAGGLGFLAPHTLGGGESAALAEFKAAEKSAQKNVSWRPINLSDVYDYFRVKNLFNSPPLPLDSRFGAGTINNGDTTTDSYNTTNNTNNYYYNTNSLMKSSGNPMNDFIDLDAIELGEGGIQ